VKGWEVKAIDQPKAARVAIEWFESRFNQELANINDLMAKFKISEALMAIYKLVWDDFCSWYLEMVKPGYEQPIDAATLEQTIVFFEKLLCLLQPFTPFVAEELWHLLRERKEGEDIIVAKWPIVGTINENILKQFTAAEDVIINIRNIRKQNNIANKVRIELFVKKNNELDTTFDSVIVKMGNLSHLDYVDDKVTNSNSFLVNANEYFVPFGDAIDLTAEKAKMEEELTYTRGFLKSVQGKLGNEKFVNGAPAQVLENERKKEADALQKIAVLEEKLASLN
jgi:valyl-tRNA synthetase